MTYSIIIPVRNEELHLPRCLDSLLRLRGNVEEREILVVDTGSGDGTVAIARERGVRVLERPGVTIAAARNAGAAETGGEILVFLDADCSVPPEWLLQAEACREHTDVVCFGSPPLPPSPPTWVQRNWFAVRRKRSPGATPWLESMNMFVRREAFVAVGGFDERLVTCEDYDLAVRLGRIGRIVADPGIIAVHHGEAASIPHFFRKERWRGTGNLAGLRYHGMSWRELPSVAAPLAYCLLATVSVPLLLAAVVAPSRPAMTAATLLLAGWQFPLLVLALSKAAADRSPARTPGLYLLLNVYFLARGTALLARPERH